MGRWPICAYDNKRLFSLNTIYNVVIEDSAYPTKYVLALLNSSLVRHIWGKLFPEVKDVFPRVKKEQLVDIPICKPPSKTGSGLVTLVDRILAAKEKDPAADTSAWEREIDERVYKLYGLTAEEIKIVEGATRGGAAP